MNISGTVEEVRFSDEQSGFTILDLDCQGDLVTAVGLFPLINEGEFLTLEGDYVTHAKFGKQFSATNVKRSDPKDISALTRYLSSGLIKGIGPKTALMLVDMFGENVLSVIEKKPVELIKVKGITLKKAQDIHDEYMAGKAMQQAIMFLQQAGLTVSLAVKVYKQYGKDSEQIVRDNPYRLIEDIEGIGFVTADRIASAIGIGKTDTLRLKAGIIYALKEAADTGGNTFLTMEELLNDSCAVLGLDSSGLSDLEAMVSGLAIDGKLKKETVDGVTAIYLRFVYLAEYGSATRLVALNNSHTLTDELNDIDGEIEDYQRVNGIILNDEQKAALACAINSGVCIITGGPGTGKTTILKCMITLLEQRGLHTALMAPTGRAAKRMSESTNRDASTIHRAIFNRGYSNSELKQIKADVVVVDEVSMMDIFLFNMLLKCIREGVRIVLLGDVDQLPSIGAGNVLKDVLSVMPSVRLTKIYRQLEESAIITNAHMINSGLMPVIDKKNKDFFFIGSDSPEQSASTIVQLVTERLPKYLGVDADKIQVLCPMKNGATGTININRLLATQLVGVSLTELKAGGEVLRINDKVMQTVNNYEQSWTRGSESGEGVFNGDIGRVVDIRVQVKELDVMFDDGRLATYTDNLSELIPAYAITVHKSQGCEFDAVVMPIVAGSPVIMTRNLLYTAVTRAKRLVVLIGQSYNLKRMIDNNFVAKRNSGLCYFIKAAQADYERLYGK